MTTEQRNPAHPTEHGTVLLATLAAIVVLGILGAAMTVMVGATNQNNTVHQLGNQAFYMAESGARYAISRIRKSGLDAVDELDGQTFTLKNGWGFELIVEATDTGPTIRFCIDSVGFTGSGGDAQKQSLNGYIVEIAKGHGKTALPTTFDYAVQVLGSSEIKLTGSSYIDSYNSANDDTQWTTAGGFTEGIIRTGAASNAVKLTGSSAIYGGISVPEGTDVSDPGKIVNDPDKVYGETGVYDEHAAGVAAIPAPSEEDEQSKPTSWNPTPDFQGWGSDTIPSGNYTEDKDFTTGNTSVTVTGDLAIDAGKDLRLSGSGSLDVVGSLSAWVKDDIEVSGGGSGLDVQGDADLQAGHDFKVSGSQTVVIGGDLDLDVGHDFKLEGSGSLRIVGDADIDVGHHFEIGGSAQLIIEGNVIIRVGKDFKVQGGTTPFVIGENASLQIYVDDGTVEFKSVDVNANNDPSQFLLVGSSDVESVSISGNSKVVGAIYTPGAELKISGGSELFGAATVDSIKEISGHSSIHFDQALNQPSSTIDLDETKLRRYWVASGTAE